MAIQKITADVISSDAITTASISDSAITAAKLAGTLDLTGKTITVATASSGDNDTSVASTAFVQQELASLVDSAPGTLNTLNELAAALGDDANFSTTVTNSIATKLPLAGGSLTGGLTITAGGDNLKLKRSSFDDILLGIGTGNSQSGFHITNTTDTVTIASIHENAPAGSLVMDSSGNIGIGTSSPDGLLHISSGTAGDAILILESDTDNNDEADNPQIWFKGDGDITKGAVRVSDNELEIISNVSAASGIKFYTGATDNTGTTDPGTSATQRMHIESNGKIDISGYTTEGAYLSSKGSFRIDIDNDNDHTDRAFIISSNNAASDLVTVLESGLVGIGTSSPSAKLHVAGAITGTDLIAHDSTGINLQTDEGTKRLVVTDDGNVIFSGQTTTFASPGFTHHTNDYLYLRGGTSGLRLDDDSSINTIQIADGSSGFIKFETGNGTERMRIDSSGRVTTPYQPAFHAYGPSAAVSTGNYVVYANTYVNTGSHYNTSNGRFTAPVAGVYLFFWSAIGNDNQDVYRWFLYKNGSVNAGGGNDIHLRQDTLATGSEYATNGSRVQMLSLSANDYVQIYFSSDSSNSGYYQSDYVNFGGYLIG